jgi:cellulose synthase/poly-beta-1,6-N-acetylglucosamine synthase-like glycosyltransferase
LNIIRINDQKKAQKLFAPYCNGWTEQNFATAETLVSGIEYATLMNTPASPALPVRLAGALSGIMKIYNVPQEQIDECIRKVLQLDYQSIGRRVLNDFKAYVHSVSEEQLKQYLLKQ